MSENRGNPAIQGRRLRAALREARDKANLTQEQAAARLEWSTSTIVRIEAGKVGVSKPNLLALLGIYGITDPDRVAELVATAKAAREKPWWDEYRGIASKQYLEFVEFEQAAARSLYYHPHFVPGILQTRDYARAILSRLGPDEEERAKRLLVFRLQRQAVLDAADPPSMVFILDESVFYRQVGDAELMRAQIAHLIELADRPNITLQVFPFTGGLAYASFVIHMFSDPADPAMLHFEGPLSDTVVTDDQAEISRWHAAFEELQVNALSVGETATFLKDLGSKG